MAPSQRNWPCTLLATIAFLSPLPAAVPQAPAANSKPKQPVEVAAEFLKLAIAGEDGDALKLVVSGTVSENKVAEIRRAGYTRSDFVLVLINDTRVEAVTTEKRARKAGEPEGHLVIMVVKAKDGAWRVKDLDVRDANELKPRIELYLSGRYNEKPAKR
jgi:hypothetical protein